MKVIELSVSNFSEAAKAIALTGAEPYSVNIMAAKAVHKVFLARGIDNRAANILKQDMLSLGGEVAVSRQVGAMKTGTSDAVVMGTLKQIALLCGKLRSQPFGLAELSLELLRLTEIKSGNKYFLCRNHKIKISADARLMGVLNVTPDSFSDGGKYFDLETACARGAELVKYGALIVDIGGESSRPGARPVSAKDEAARILPVIKTLAGKIKAPLSVDTYKPETARAALKAGASIINDISGLGYGGRKMARLIASEKAGLVIMHMKGKPSDMQKAPKYDDLVSEIYDFFEERSSLALECGVRKESIMLDPGIGFGKTAEHNLELLKRLKEFKSLGFPLVVGTSRKSFLGKVLGLENPLERLQGSVASALWASDHGADFLRVHDVMETAQALKIYGAIKASA
ncbi:MAG TPA: dihydropteroate synthase [Elusimicrobia bacterium]|nr:MAG: dihydropteroate synthase [Elusimicrobia bacterium RIFOXYA12_FULL_49_49]OGS14763.1 MAG: dihydropteroate synthase [Elusimicrobia bacterium RIFOXYA2_FULL_47_53]OGS25586.1 MAG: dihydropteroate synthase [Elusimicrobia bacterium RIFOXYB12_FULL_50_12]OGS28953.1 MAG: dihydropteroate synthase [Elusimicrobia bacterium RIFOXYB2_FULL_46_23]HBU69605.1 dihydropteroate synthase [Elusimicrobiota bacterium]